jgi:hypothetical protein
MDRRNESGDDNDDVADNHDYDYDYDYDYDNDRDSDNNVDPPDASNGADANNYNNNYPRFLFPKKFRSIVAKARW